jgi:CMP-N,N'-diacetyllegionaminic acid synthase
MSNGKNGTKILIPARGGSKRIPLKNIYKVNGNPLISYIINACKDANLGEIWVSTDSKEISNVAKEYGANIINRPDNISEDVSTAEDVMLHFINNVDCDELIFAEPTSPLLTGEDIYNTYKLFKDKNYDTCHTIINKKYFLWKQVNGKWNPVNFNKEIR